MAVSVPLLAPRSSDEHDPQPKRPVDRRVEELVTTVGVGAASRLGIELAAYLSGQMGTAATLLALNEAHGDVYFDVPSEAAVDPAAAEATFRSRAAVIDVQTHPVRTSRATTRGAEALFGFLMLRRPSEAAHVLGKLLLAVGPALILWGTDSVWYGPPPALIDAFRSFVIPEPMQERYGYPALTPEMKAAILGGNAAGLYGVDTAPSPIDPAQLAEARAELARRLP